MSAQALRLTETPSVLEVCTAPTGRTVSPSRRPGAAARPGAGSPHRGRMEEIRSIRASDVRSAWASADILK